MEKTQRNNIMLAFFTSLAVIVIVSIIGFFTLGKYRKSYKARLKPQNTGYRVKYRDVSLNSFVSEGDKVKAGDTLAIWRLQT